MLARRYNSIDQIRDSDHSPVYGAVSLRIGPNANKGHTFKKVTPLVSSDSQLIATIPPDAMLETVSRNDLFRILVNSSGMIEPMSKQLLREVAPFFSPAYIHRDTLIIKSGDTSSSSLLFVIRGSVKLITEKYELLTVGPGQWFGGEALIEDMSGYTAVAEEDTVCLSLSVNGTLPSRCVRGRNRATHQEGLPRIRAVCEATADGSGAVCGRLSSSLWRDWSPCWTT